MTQKLSPSNPDEDDDFDSLSGFFSSFQVALVFFIMSPMNMANNDEIHDPILEQLDDMNSYFHRAQRLSTRHQQEAEEVTPVQTNNAKSNGANTRKSCILLFPDTESAIQNLITVADSLSQERKASKKAFLRRLETKFFLPSFPSTTTEAVETVDPSAVASHVAGALLEMTRIFELPPGEAEILMELGDLKTIATADDSLLQTIPLDPRTRKILHSFFGSSQGRKGIARFSQGPATSQQRQLRQHHTDSHSLASVANQLFPQSNSSRLGTSLTQNSRHAHSVHYPLQAHCQVPQSKPPQQHQFFNPSMADESWNQPEFSQGSLFDSFDDDEDNIPAVDEYTFDDLNSEPNISGSSYLFPTSALMEVTPLSGGNHNFDMHRSDSRFSASHPTAIHSSTMNASAFPSNEAGNAINPYANPAGQSFNRNSWSRRQSMSQTYNSVSRQNSPYPVEQPAYHHSQHVNLQNEMDNMVTDGRQYGHSGLQVSSPWQIDHQSLHQYSNQNQQFFRDRGSRR